MFKAGIGNLVRGLFSFGNSESKNAKTVKITVLGGIASFFIVLVIIIGAVSYLLGNVQKNVERVDNLLKGGCILCTNEELAQMKEDQFKTKLNIIGDVFGAHVDKVVLASTVLFQGDYYEVLDAEYDKDFDEKSFTEKVRNFLGVLSVTGSTSYDGITQSEIDMLDSALIIMFNSNVNDKYDEESYKNALINSGFGLKSRVAKDEELEGVSFLEWLASKSEYVASSIGDAAICVTKSSWEKTVGVFHSLPLINSFSNQGNLVDAYNRFTSTANICKYGFIGGTFDDVRQMEEELDKMSEGSEKSAQESKILGKKKEIADNIIEFAEFYKFLFPEEEDTCTYASSAGTGDMTNWRQTDERWGSIPLGTGGLSVAQAGCTSTSMAYLIAKSGTKLTVPSIDPGVFVKNASYISSNLYWDSWTGIAPNFTTISRENSVSMSNAVSVLSNELNRPCGNNNQRFIILYLSLGHWVAVDHIENNTVYVMDPSYSESGLARLEDTKKGHSLSSYNSFCATDVTFGSTGSSSSTGTSNLDYNSVEYEKRILNLSKYHQCGTNSIIKDLTKNGINMCNTGCGTASLMAAYYMFTGEDFDTEKFFNDAIEQGYLSKSSGNNAWYFQSPERAPLFKANWGLSGQAIPRGSNASETMDNIISSLKEGKKVLFHIRANNGMYYSLSVGHYILLDHYDEKTNQIYVFDPYPDNNPEREGYKTSQWLVTNLIPYISSNAGTGMSAISSDRVNGSNVCYRPSGSMEDLTDMLGRLEGMLGETCTVRGQPGYVARKIYADLADVGNSTAYGITQKYGVYMADEIGYTTFNSDMSNGCVEQSYIKEMAIKYMETRVEDMRQYFEEVSGGKKLEEYQYHALALINHHWPVGSYHLMDELAELDDVRSYEGYRLFLKYNGLEGIFGGIIRREVEFHLFYNGNYNAERDFSHYNDPDTSYYWSREYYNERVKLYKSE